MVERDVAGKQVSGAFVRPNTEPLLDYFFRHLDYYFYSLVQLLGRKFCPRACHLCNFRVDAVGSDYRLCLKGVQLVSLDYRFLALPR